MAQLGSHCPSAKLVSQGAPYGRLPGTIALTLPGTDAASLILALDAAGFAVSAGSACSAGSSEASHVLLAQGDSQKEALSFIRISFDERVSSTQFEHFAEVLGNLAGN